MKQLLIVTLGVLLAACGNSSIESLTGTGKAGDSRVVVAVLDTGINPYHKFLYAGSPIYPDSAPSAVTPEVLAEFGIDAAHIIDVQRTGDYAIDFLRDREMWMAIERGVPYWIKNTNIIVASFVDATAGEIPILAEGSTHGVGTSGSVLTANPEAIVFFIEQGDTGIGSDETHIYAFAHPAVDILSTSYGVSQALGLLPAPEYGAFLGTFNGVVNLGKLHFSSSGNGPGLSNFRAGAGPWWSIGASGYEEGSNNGRTVLSGVLPDFIADFTQELPYCLACEDGYSFVGGTSFSTPRSAGVASKVLLETRRALGHSGGIVVSVDAAPVMAAGNGQSVTNWQIRRALEEAAFVPTVTDYDPTTLPDDVLGLSIGLPINPAAPWLQIGWGEISADSSKHVVENALAVLGFGGGQGLGKAMGFCEFNTLLMQERIAYWNQVVPAVRPILIEVDPVGLGSGEAGGPAATTPYIFCESAVPAVPVP